MTWLPLSPGDPFGPHNLPYGAGPDGVVVRVGDQVLDLSGAEAAGLVDAGGVLAGQSNLDRFLAAGRATWSAVRRRLGELLADESHRPAVQPLLRPLDSVRLALPFTIADYVDFYSSEFHATNVGRILRPGQPPLLPNWRHLPIGYHGRAGTVIVSGTPVTRPRGQRRGSGGGGGGSGGDGPEFGPSTKLDLEAEVGFVVGRPSALGQPVPADAFRDHVFGVVLVNDWSARDIQLWESQPLGPFLGKSFATSISAWVVPLEALEPAQVPAPPQDPPVLEYLRQADRATYDLRLEIWWNGTRVSRPPFRALYWTPAQQLAHLTVNGASLRTGDLYASGTVSGPEPDQVGCFLELTRDGAEPVRLGDGSMRTFIEDGDQITIAGVAVGADDRLVGLGDVTTTIVSGV